MCCSNLISVCATIPIVIQCGFHALGRYLSLNEVQQTTTRVFEEKASIKAQNSDLPDGVVVVDSDTDPEIQDINAVAKNKLGSNPHPDPNLLQDSLS